MTAKSCDWTGFPVELLLRADEEGISLPGGGRYDKAAMHDDDRVASAVWRIIQREGRVVPYTARGESLLRGLSAKEARNVLYAIQLDPNHEAGNTTGWLISRTEIDLQLVKVLLGSKDGAVRAFALHLMSESPNTICGEIACEYLDDTDDHVRHNAMEIVMDSRYSPAFSRLVGYLHAPDINVRSLAIESLGKIGNSEAIGPIRDLYQRIEPDRKRMLKEGGEAFWDAYSLSLESAHALFRLGEWDANQLVRLMQDICEEVGPLASFVDMEYMLHEVYSSDFIEPLIGMARSEQPHVREIAWRYLPGDDERVQQFCAEHLDRWDDLSLMMDALMVLSRHSESLSDQLRQQVHSTLMRVVHGWEWSSHRTFQCLINLDAVEVIEPLMGILKGDEPIRATTTEMIIGMLSEWIDDNSTTVTPRQYIPETRVQRRLIGEHYHELMDVLEKEFLRNIEAYPSHRSLELILGIFRNLGEYRPAMLAAAVNRRVSEISLVAADLLLGAGDDHGIEYLISLLVEPETDGLQRWAAVGVLVSHKHNSTVEPLIRLTSHPDEDVRWAAIETLGQLEDERAIKPAIRLLEDRSKWVRAASARALGHLRTPSAIPSLKNLVNDPSEHPRYRAVEALGRICGTDGIPFLMTATLDKNYAVQRAALRAVSEIMERAAQA